MKNDLKTLIQGIALGALAGLQQPATATALSPVKDRSEEEAASRLKALKASLSRPSFILKTINGSSGDYEGNYHTSHRSHSSHRSHYSSSSSSSYGSYSSGGSSSGSYSSGTTSSSSYSPKTSSSPTKTYVEAPVNSSPAKSYSPLTSPSPNSPSVVTSTPARAVTSYKLGDRLLSFGQKGSDVVELKNRLIQRGYYVRTGELPLTDIFDEPTRDAVKKLQRAHNLSEDALVDPALTVYLADNASVAPSFTSPALGSRDLQWGLVGPDVAELKEKLVRKGYLKLKPKQKINGRFDDATEQAVKDLQLANELPVNGAVTATEIKLLR